jgi:hypothetical protein
MVPPVPPPLVFGPHMLDERRARRRIDGDDLLPETGDELPAMPGGALVEPEPDLVEVRLQMGVADGTLMRAEGSRVRRETTRCTRVSMPLPIPRSL